MVTLAVLQALLGYASESLWLRHARRQVTESINGTLTGQIDLDRHGGHTLARVTIRVLQRILALTAAIRHNDRIGQPVRRSLPAYDH